MRDPLQRLNLAPAERRLVVAIGVAVFLVLNYWLVWPRFADWAQLGGQLDDRRQKLEVQRREAERLPNHQAALRKLEGEGVAVPAGDEAAMFLTTVQSLARELRLPVNTWGAPMTPRSAPGVTNQFFEERQLSVVSTPAEATLVDFLERLSSADSIFRVRSLTLRPGAVDPRSGGPTNLDARFTIVASYKKVGPAPSPGAAGARTNAPAGSTNAAAPRQP
jgi:hypothetical protein